MQEAVYTVAVGQQHQSVPTDAGAAASICACTGNGTALCSVCCIRDNNCTQRLVCCENDAEYRYECSSNTSAQGLACSETSGMQWSTVTATAVLYCNAGTVEVITVVYAAGVPTLCS